MAKVLTGDQEGMSESRGTPEASMEEILASKSVFAIVRHRSIKPA